MLKTKKELMLELGKLNLELTDIKLKISAVIDLFDSVPQDVTLSSLRAVYAKITGAKPLLSELKVDGHGIILTASCNFNRIPERFMASKRRDREYVYARAFYCLLCRDLGLRTDSELALDTKRDRTTIIHYRKLHDTDVTFRKRYDAFVNSMM